MVCTCCASSFALALHSIALSLYPLPAFCAYITLCTFRTLYGYPRLKFNEPCTFSINARKLFRTKSCLVVSWCIDISFCSTYISYSSLFLFCRSRSETILGNKNGTTWWLLSFSPTWKIWLKTGSNFLESYKFSFICYLQSNATAIVNQEVFQWYLNRMVNK